MRSKLFIIAIFGLISVGTSALSAQDDPVKVLVGRLDLQKYKATIKGLTQFGDRLQGTERNRRAVDWIEAQLKSYGCANVERVTFISSVPPQPSQQSVGTPPSSVIATGEIRSGVGGSRLRGVTRPTTPNNDPAAQPNPALLALNSEPSASGPQDEVYCTKVGATR